MSADYVTPRSVLATVRRLDKVGSIDLAYKLLTYLVEKNPTYQLALVRLIELEMKMGNTSNLDKRMDTLMNIRRAPRSILVNIRESMDSDRFIFAPNREKIIEEMDKLLGSNIYEDKAMQEKGFGAEDTRIIDWGVKFIEVNTKARKILEILGKKGQSLALAESCTGGLLASAFVSVSGASEVFLGGLICYSSKAKVELAGVSSESAFDNFAVNEGCSKEFAKGSLDKFCSDYAISTTGFAEDAKEMYLSIATKSQIWTYREVFFGSRNEIREAQVEFVLSKILEMLS